MKILKCMITCMALMAVAVSGLAQQTTTQTPTPTQQVPQTQIPPQNLQMAQQGCQKNIGFFPTPSKLMCLMTALGLTQNNAKPKALALIFNVCHGRMIQPPPGTTPKAYKTLGECLSDPTAVNNINKELKAQGLPEIKIVNPSVLGTTTPSTTGTPVTPTPGTTTGTGTTTTTTPAQ